MNSKTAKQTHVIEPFNLIDQLAQGDGEETDAGMREWADEHGLDISVIAADNRKHLKNAVALAKKQITEQNSTNHLPQTVTSVSEADRVLEVLGNEFRLAARNASGQSDTDKIRRAKQMLRLHNMMAKA